ncbi:Plasmodium exported protein (PHISTc), unknown function [Plasmodium sp. gorilla clade G2]|uniref:Plasmodium exported protein (PHISTc), unknown function n=1 Tax=Plasmodium sp. gorilla clade G2 TaxID=880535 RepID=UPI000D204BA8|nr:Plasmodium exported protein (PHISTc), unknown function [Plasmodium sp. gorilla clade G2]SOV10647.1 Plasmodium exported protein (PHISTc), unknown function [Plasmodium sp. gorilla clade G2]
MRHKNAYIFKMSNLIILVFLTIYILLFHPTQHKSISAYINFTNSQALMKSTHKRKLAQKLKNLIQKKILGKVFNSQVNEKEVPHENEKEIPHVNEKEVPHVNEKEVPHVNVDGTPLYNKTYLSHKEKKIDSQNRNRPINSINNNDAKENKKNDYDIVGNTQKKYKKYNKKSNNINDQKKKYTVRLFLKNIDDEKVEYIQNLTDEKIDIMIQNIHENITKDELFFIWTNVRYNYIRKYVDVMNELWSYVKEESDKNNFSDIAFNKVWWKLYPELISEFREEDNNIYNDFLNIFNTEICDPAIYINFINMTRKIWNEIISVMRYKWITIIPHNFPPRINK